MTFEIIKTIFEILYFIILLVLLYFLGYLKAKIEDGKAIEKLLVDELLKIENIKNNEVTEGE